MPSLATADVRRAARRLIQCGGEPTCPGIDAITGAGWNDVLHAVSPALYPYLDFTLRRARLIDAIPEHARALLAAARRASIATSLQRRSVIRSALSSLGASGIPTILLKGAAVAHTAYPEPHLRPMTDVDLWVRDAHLTSAVRCLLQNGFVVPPGVLADGIVSPLLDQRRLRAEPAGILVELHGSVRSLAGLSDERLERCWNNAVPVSIGEIHSRALCPADMLLHTCLHMARTDRFASSQLSLLDVHLIARHCADRVDWVALARDARTEGVAAYLTVALVVARTVWGARVPDEYFAAVGDVKALGEMESLALEQVWEKNRGLPSVLENVLRQPAAAARLGAVARRIFLQPWQLPAGQKRHPWTAARWVIHRMKIDLAVKLPRYVRAARGGFASYDLRRRAALAARRGRIGILANEAESQLRGVRLGSDY
jgi:hypothetical protein